LLTNTNLVTHRW